MRDVVLSQPCGSDFFNQIELDDVAGEGDANAESDIDLLVTAVCAVCSCSGPVRASGVVHGS